MPVRIRGLRELNRSLQKANRETAKTVRDALKQAAEPVVRSAKAKEGQWAGAKINTIGPRVVGRGVFVTQRARKVSGLRPDYGRLQQLRAFEPALEENQDEVEREVEKALDSMLRSSGL